MSYLSEIEARVARAREAQPGTIAWEARRAECFSFTAILLEIVKECARKITFFAYCPVCEAALDTTPHSEACPLGAIMQTTKEENNAE